MTAVEAALQGIRATLEEFTVNIARLSAGHDVDFGEAVEEHLAAALRLAMQPLLRSAVRAAPDFGQFAELRVDGDLTSGDSARCLVSFEDRSTLQSRDGARVRQFRRTIEMTAVLSLRPIVIRECAFREVT